MRNEDRRILQAIIDKHDTVADAAAAIGLVGQYANQSLWNWLVRGVPTRWRKPVWLWCRANGITTSDDWCEPELRSVQRRALKRMAKRSAHPPKNGESDGRTRQGEPQSKAQRKGQRARDQRRPQQRRAGRGLSTMVAQD